MTDPDVPSYPVPLKLLVRSALLNALAFTNGHQKDAAALLGISPRVMNYQMLIHGIPRARTGWTRYSPRYHPRPRRPITTHLEDITND